MGAFAEGSTHLTKRNTPLLMQNQDPEAWLLSNHTEIHEAQPSSSPRVV